MPSVGAKSEVSHPSSNAEDGILSNAHPDVHQQQEQPEQCQQALELDLPSCDTIRYVPGVTFSAEDGSEACGAPEKKNHDKAAEESNSQPYQSRIE